MPRVPLLQQRQVPEVTRLPRAGQIAPTTAEFEAQRGLGEAVGRVGDDIHERVIQRQKELNKIYATDAVARFQQSMTQGFIDAKATRGKDSIGVHDSYRAAALKESQSGKFLNNLSPAATNLYRAGVSSLISGWSKTLATHESGQHQVNKKDDAALDLQTRITDIIQNTPGDEGAIAIHRQALVESVTETLGAKEALAFGKLFDKEVKRQSDDASLANVEARIAPLIDAGDFDSALLIATDRNNGLSKSDREAVENDIKTKKKLKGENDKKVLKDQQNTDENNILDMMTQDTLPLNINNVIESSSLEPKDKRTYLKLADAFAKGDDLKQFDPDVYVSLEERILKGGFDTDEKVAEINTEIFQALEDRKISSTQYQSLKGDISKDIRSEDKAQRDLQAGYISSLNVLTRRYIWNAEADPDFDNIEAARENAAKGANKVAELKQWFIDNPEATIPQMDEMFEKLTTFAKKCINIF